MLQAASAAAKKSVVKKDIQMVVFISDRTFIKAYGLYNKLFTDGFYIAADRLLGSMLAAAARKLPIQSSCKNSQPRFLVNFLCIALLIAATPRNTTIIETGSRHFLAICRKNGWVTAAEVRRP